MVAYLIIGIELAILYGVFWSIFIREPKALVIKGPLWGSYNKELGQLTTGGVGPRFPSQLLDEIDNRQSGGYQSHHWDLVPSSASRRSRHQAMTGRGRSQRAQLRRDQELRYGWVSAELVEVEKTFIGKFFQNLSRAINLISVRVP